MLVIGSLRERLTDRQYAERSPQPPHSNSRGGMNTVVPLPGVVSIAVTGVPLYAAFAEVPTASDRTQPR